MRLETIYKVVIRQIVVKNERNFPKILKSKKWNFLYKWIIDTTPLLNRNKISTRIYWILNGIKNFNDKRCCCKRCKAPFFNKDANAIFGYRKYCNTKCANNDDDVRNKIE